MFDVQTCKRCLCGVLLTIANAAVAAPALEVAYLDRNPVIDGQLDDGLDTLEAHRFDHVIRFDNPAMPDARVRYRLAYTATHLYVHISTSDPEVRYHRRGYLWGDGYRLLLGLPVDQASSGATAEYYDMSFSPSRDPNLAWDRQRIAAYNFVQTGRRFSEATQSQEAATEDGSGFEALIAWSDIPPYHPWFRKHIGFNLYFAKGFETEAEGHFPYGHAVVRDEGIWDEEIERRAYRLMRFETPERLPDGFAALQLERSHLAPGAPLGTRLLGAAAPTNQLRVRDAADSVVFEAEAPAAPHGQQRWALPELDVGAYTAELKAGSVTLKQPFAVLPELEYDSLRVPLEDEAATELAGAAATVGLELQELEQAMRKLKPYETGAELVAQLEAFDAHHARVVAGDDPYADLRGPYRRGFRSEIDGTFQPYGVRLPEDYDPNRTYPLLVFLHGSGQGEQRVLEEQRGNGRFIEIAPLGRDMFRAYSSAESQRDIVEAIEDAMRQFPVDPERIVIGGFSMGGYGALRTFYESPERYRGVAVFAGHPNLANEWLDGDYPNFLEAAYLLAFADVPVFIYHGRKDAGLPVGLAEQLAETLTSHGAGVTARFIDDKGHEYQDAETHALYGAWLDAVVRD